MRSARDIAGDRFEFFGDGLFLGLVCLTSKNSLEGSNGLCDCGFSENYNAAKVVEVG